MIAPTRTETSQTGAVKAPFLTFLRRDASHRAASSVEDHRVALITCLTLAASEDQAVDQVSLKAMARHATFRTGSAKVLCPLSLARVHHSVMVVECVRQEALVATGVAQAGAKVNRMPVQDLPVESMSVLKHPSVRPPLPNRTINGDQR